MSSSEDKWPAFMCTDFDEAFCWLKRRRCIGRLDCDWYDGIFKRMDVRKMDEKLNSDKLGGFGKTLDFRPGDADQLQYLADTLEEMNWKKFEDEILILRRITGMARAMEQAVEKR